jgi:hypothetical protein
MVMTSTFVFGQKKYGHGRGEAQVETMKKELVLTDQQYASIKDINAKYKGKHMALRGDSTLKSEAKHDQMKALHKDRQNEIQKVLTPDQQTKWKAYKKQQADLRKEKHKADKAERDAKLKTELSLSDDQFNKLDATNKAFREKYREAKKNNADKTAMKKLADEHEASLKSILSEEQFTKWKAHKEEKKAQLKKFRKHQRREQRK